MNINLNLDVINFNNKPTKKDMGGIQKRIGNATKEVDIMELANLISKGCSFKCAALEGGSKNINWKSQQVFAIDIDNDDTNNIVTIDDIIKRCISYDVMPNFIYPTFSHTDEVPRFRVVFTTPTPIDDIRLRNVIQFALLNLFPESDMQCKDLSRLFLGTNKEIIPMDFTDHIDPYELVQSMMGYMRAIDIKNFKRNIKKYCETVCLNVIDSLPNIRLLDRELKNDEIEESTISSIIYIIEQEVESSKREFFNFNISIDEVLKGTLKTEGKAKGSKYLVTDTKNCNEEATIRKFKFEEFSKKCRLWREFTDGTRWCYHNEIFGIATNMWRVEGAETRMVNSINSNSDYKDKENKCVNTIQGARYYKYAPKRCCDFCPYHKECKNKGVNMLMSAKLNRGSIRKLEEVNLKPLAKAEEELKVAVKEALDANDEDIHVIKAPTGIGKTEALKGIDDYYGMCIAYPNHRLGDDIVERLDIDDVIHLKPLKIHNEELLSQYVRLVSVGANSSANEILKNYVKNTPVKNYATKEEDIKIKEDVNTINKFLKDRLDAFKTTRPILCTHASMLAKQNKETHTYIIDEDIILSSVLNSIHLDYEPIEKAYLLSQAYQKDSTLSVALKGILDTMLVSKEKHSTVQELDLINVPKALLNGFIKAYSDKLTINIRDYIKIQYISSEKKMDGSYVTCGIARKELPAKKCIIMSATINTDIIKALYPKRKIHIVDLGDVETKGKVVLHYQGFSRAYMQKNFKRAIKIVKDEAPNINNVITFKKYASQVSKENLDVIATYGACSGLDGYKGQDLIVLGTPHLNATSYLLITALVLDKKTTIIEGCDYTPVDRNGYEFCFMTMNPDLYDQTSLLLREVQFYLIGTEIEQAIGRARILRNECTVHLFSNYPVRNCTIYS